MPVTVKFSRDFYDKFGHEAVDELVNYLNQIDSGYRLELRDLNEQNFVRFDARLEQRTAELKAEFGHGIDQLRTEIAAARADTIKWMFFFIATAVLAILGLG